MAPLYKLENKMKILQSMADNIHMDKDNNMNKHHMDMAPNTNNYQDPSNRKNHMTDIKRTPEHQMQR